MRFGFIGRKTTPIKLITVDLTYCRLVTELQNQATPLQFQLKNGTSIFVYETSPSSEPVLLASSEKLESAGKEMTFPFFMWSPSFEQS